MDDPDFAIAARESDGPPFRRRGPARAGRGLATGLVILLAAALMSRGLVQALRDPPGRQLPDSMTGLRAPSVIAAYGTRIWVASSSGTGGGSVTELDAAGARRIWTVSGARYGLDDPSVIAADGTRIWVANVPLNGDGTVAAGGSVTELDARTGRRIRTLSGARYGFDDPAAIATDGTRVWVANDPPTGGSVTEVDAATGQWVRTLRRGISLPSVIVLAGGYVWIASSCDDGAPGDTVTELSARTGRLVRTLSGGRYAFACTAGIAVRAGQLWVVNSGSGPPGGGSVTELDARDGRVIRTISAAPYGFGSPVAITASGSSIWVASSEPDTTGGSVTELRARDGSLLRTLKSENGVRAAIDGSWFRILVRGDYGLGSPSAIAAGSAHIWVLNSGAPITILSSQ